MRIALLNMLNQVLRCPIVEAALSGVIEQPSDIHGPLAAYGRAATFSAYLTRMRVTSSATSCSP